MRRTITQIFLLAFLGLTVVCFGCTSTFGQAQTDSGSQQPILRPLNPTATHHFKRVLIIILENQNYENAISDPYLHSLAETGASFTNFHGLFHPSYSNYLAMVTGKAIGTHFNFQRDLNEKTIADLLKSKALTWKNYAEGYPEKIDLKGYPNQCFTNPTFGRYARKHVPFISFIQIQKNECRNIVPATQFIEDLKNNSLPNYMFYSPNLDNDGHDTGLAFASKWLKGFLEPLLQNSTFMKDTLIVVTFDESGKGPHDTNHIYTVFLGDMVKLGEYKGNYNHYNLLRTIEENFGLGTLSDGDGTAEPITDVWNAKPITEVQK